MSPARVTVIVTVLWGSLPVPCCLPRVRRGPKLCNLRLLHTLFGLMAPTVFEIYLDDEDDGFTTTLEGKWMAKPLLKGLITPFLDNLRKQRQNPLYATKHLSSVTVNGVQLAMAGPGSWHAPANTFVDDSSGPIIVELGLDLAESGMSHGSELNGAQPSPIFATRRFKVSLSAGARVLGGVPGSSLTKRRSSKSLVVHVRCHGVEMGATVNRKWVEQSIRDSVIVPFFKEFDQMSTLGAPSSDEGIASLTLAVAEGADPIASAEGDEVDRLLAAPLSRFAAGGLVEIQISLGRRSDEEVAEADTGSGFTARDASPAALPSRNSSALDRARRANSQRQLTNGSSVGPGGMGSRPYLQSPGKVEELQSPPMPASPVSLIDLESDHI